MFTLEISIILDAAATSLSFGDFSTDAVKKAAVSPTLLKLGHRLAESAREEFSGDLYYRGGMASGFATRWEGGDDVAVTQSAGHDAPVIFGTSGGYSGFPVPVKEWAMEKLGKSAEVAGAIAYKVMDEGTSKYFGAHKYPGGGRIGFEYPEYIVKIKEFKEIVESAKKIGLAVVNYALAKSRGVTF